MWINNMLCTHFYNVQSQHVKRSSRAVIHISNPSLNWKFFFVYIFILLIQQQHFYSERIQLAKAAHTDHLACYNRWGAKNIRFIVKGKIVSRITAGSDERRDLVACNKNHREKTGKIRKRTNKSHIQHLCTVHTRTHAHNTQTRARAKTASCGLGLYTKHARHM